MLNLRFSESRRGHRIWRSGYAFLRNRESRFPV